MDEHNNGNLPSGLFGTEVAVQETEPLQITTPRNNTNIDYTNDRTFKKAGCSFLMVYQGLTHVVRKTLKREGKRADQALGIAAVYARVAGYCNGEKKICFASPHTIANEVSLSVSTVRRHIKWLVDHGYIIDETPNWTHRPHRLNTRPTRIKVVADNETFAREV